MAPHRVGGSDCRLWVLLHEFACLKLFARLFSTRQTPWPRNFLASLSTRVYIHKVYIVTGRAVPEGNTVYVMVQELTRYGEPRTSTIWKPSTGEGFDARDARYDDIDWSLERKTPEYSIPASHHTQLSRRIVRTPNGIEDA